jgi:type IV pilus assembly protein PilY1
MEIKMKHCISIFTIALIITGSLTCISADDTEFFTTKITPDVWILLDTSGSMTWDMQGCKTWGEGSPGYEGRDTNGDGLPNDSRMYQVKNSLYNIVSDPEVDIRWGLGTFYQEKTWGPSDNHYKTAAFYPFWSECYASPFPYSNPNMWWHSATRNFAYEAFHIRVQIAEGAPSHINEILSWIDNNSNNFKELKAQGGTPIAGALRGVRYEYQSTIPSDNARWCRGYYVLLLTDGEPTYGIDQETYNQGKNAKWSDYNGSSPTWMKQQCWQEADSLMHTYIPPQGNDPAQVVQIKTYVIGLGLEGSSTLDSIAFYGGTDKYYSASDPDELNTILREIISEILSVTTSYSGGEVTSIQEQFITSNYDSKMYLCSFVPSNQPIWKGHLRAVKMCLGEFHLDSIPDSLIYWDAGGILDSTGIQNRNIYTEKELFFTPFDSWNITPADLDVSSATERDNIINIVYSGRQNGTTGYLGDIFHSSPLLVKGPNYFYEDDDFFKYRTYQNANRPAVVYAGGNDGMIHCFSDSTGTELWGFIPHDQLPYLKYMQTEHRYFEDANVMAADVWFPEMSIDSFKNEDEWRTILMVGQRQGGYNYSALDVTDPNNPDFLFNFTDSMVNLGETHSDPMIFKVHKNSFDPTNERFFAFIGGGYWPDSLYNKYNPQTTLPFGNALYALDIFNMAVNSSPIMGDDYYKIPPTPYYADSMVWPFPSRPAVIDTNLDSYADILYIGDIAGQLWKVVLNGNDSSDVIVNNWEAEIIFKAPRPNKEANDYLFQPIFYPPTLAWDGRRWWIYFGTGDRMNPTNENTLNRFYAIIDSSYTTPLTEDDLKRVSDPQGTGPLTNTEIISGAYKGWYYLFSDFDNTDSIGKRDGEKVVSSATVLLDTIIFTTFQPHDQNNPCISESGIARLYKMHYKTGAYSNVSPSEIIGIGIPQTPRYSYDINGDGQKVVNLPGKVIVTDSPNIGIRRKVIWWREIM